MAKSVPLTEMTIEALQAQKQTFTAILAVMAGVAVVYIGTMLYYMANPGESKSPLTLSIVPFLGLTVTSLPLQMRLGAIRKEIARRNGTA
jgi:uncharacterized membrane protein